MGGAFDRLIVTDASPRRLRPDAAEDAHWSTGSGIMLACALGLSGWFGIVRLVEWIVRLLV